MKIFVDDIPPEGLSLKSYEEGSSLLEEKLSFHSPVKIRARLRKDGEKVLLSGKIETELGLVCSRCLEPCKHNLFTILKLIYYPLPSKAVEGDNLELNEEDLKTGYYREGIIDLREDVREAIILALPGKPLCRPECQGLCPHCGTNLNERDCDCRETIIDPRLAKLGKLLKGKD